MADYSTSLQANYLPPITRTGRILQWVRIGWLGVALVLFVFFLISIPGTYHMLQTPCAADLSDCISWAQPTPLVVTEIEQAGISLQASALFLTCLYTLTSLVFWAVGLLIYYYRSDQWFSLLVAHLMVIIGFGGPSLVMSSGLEFIGLHFPTIVVAVIGGLLALSLYQVLSIFFLTFPNGRFYGRWNIVPFILICLNTLAWIIPTSSPLNILHWPTSLSNAWMLIVFGSHVVVQVVRYRKMYTPVERQQTKWLIYGFAVPVFTFFGASLLLGASTNGIVGIHPLANDTLLIVLYLPIAIAVGIAILRYRLWDIDIIISRTLIYGSLTAVVVGIYVVVVGALGLIFQQRQSFLISLTATGVVAVSFQPLRARIQHLIDRYVYGERNNPYAVISRLSERLENFTAPGTLLPGSAETIAQALKLPYVAIALKDGETFKTDAVFGQPMDRGRITTLPLNYANETVGHMIIGQLPGDKALDSTARQLLENIARQTGIAAHAVQLSLALQHSRQQIITAREEERRRLRRDLHDGLGPALAAHTLKVGVARALIESNPQVASAIMTELETNLANSLIDIRRLVYNLRPPVLDQLGLAGALREFVAQYSTSAEAHKLQFALNIPDTLPTLPAAVEVAAYRIVQEAATNVIRHAHARHCEISLILDEALTIRVADDGVGVPQQVKRGVGLNAIRERAEELGGLFTFSSAPGEGTQVTVRIPI